MQKKDFRKIFGYLLIGFPFALIFVVCLNVMGLWETIGIFLGAIALTAFIVAGAYLLIVDNKPKACKKKGFNG